MGFSSGDDYKLALAFDGDRFMTPWLAVMGGRAPAVPMVDVHLTHGGGTVRAVKAKVVPVPEIVQIMHRSVVEEFGNESHWPKHVLVRYQWTEEVEVDATAGAYVLLGFGVIVASIASSSALLSHQAKLGSFFREIVREDEDGGAGGGGGALLAGRPAQGGTLASPGAEGRSQPGQAKHD